MKEINPNKTFMSTNRESRDGLKNMLLVTNNWFEKHVVGDKQFQGGDLVLKWDKASEARGKHFKFQKLWLGPYETTKNIGDATY